MGEYVRVLNQLALVDGWFVGCVGGWLVRWLVDRFIRPSVCLVGRWLFGRVVEWLVDRSIAVFGWPID